MIHCTCGHFLVESESRRKFNTLRLDALSFPHYVIKKGRPHGARHGKTEAQKQYHIAFNAWKRCRKRVDGQEEHYKGIHDRFLLHQVYCESQLKNGWTEQKCIVMDELAQQDDTYRLSIEEFKSRAAVLLKNRFHPESGEEVAQPKSPQQYRRWHPSSSRDSWWNWDTSKSWWSS